MVMNIMVNTVRERENKKGKGKIIKYKWRKEKKGMRKRNTDGRHTREFNIWNMELL